MSSDVKKLMSRLGSFRPSDRSLLQTHFSDPCRAPVALEAIKEFVLVWERADWLEAYSIERIGKWVGKTQPNSFVGSLMAWAESDDTDARRALIVGLTKGQSERKPEASARPMFGTGGLAHAGW